jgi:hypothetical protein
MKKWLFLLCKLEKQVQRDWSYLLLHELESRGAVQIRYLHSHSYDGRKHSYKETGDFHHHESRRETVAKEYIISVYPRQ